MEVRRFVFSKIFVLKGLSNGEAGVVELVLRLIGGDEIEDADDQENVGEAGDEKVESAMLDIEDEVVARDSARLGFVILPLVSRRANLARGFSTAWSNGEPVAEDIATGAPRN